MPKIVVIIQARISSTRLHGKILMQLGDKSVLAHAVDRVRQCTKVDYVIVATTTLPADDATVEECKKIGVKYSRGSSDNVLERYYLAAKENSADIVVRITSDCPFIDPVLLGDMLCKFNNQNIDYLSNTISRSYPRGFDAEIFTFAVLEKTYHEAKEVYEQEHVTPYIYLHPERFNISDYGDNVDNSDLRVTLDTVEDWEVIQKVYKGLSNKTDFSYIDVVRYLRHNPDIVKINATIEQKKLGE